MYIQEVPQEHTEEIKEILARNNSFVFDREDIKRLFYFYYRYIKRFSRGVNAMKQMEKDLSCKNCVSKVIYFFKTNYS